MEQHGPTAVQNASGALARARERVEAQRMERAAVMRDLAHSTIPDALPFIRELVKLGLIRGWRDVSYVGPVRVIGVEAIVPVRKAKR